MAKKLIAMPINTASAANMLADPTFFAQEAAGLKALLQSMPVQRICVVHCQGEVEYTRQLELYEWVIYVDNPAAFAAVMDSGINELHHNVVTKTML